MRQEEYERMGRRWTESDDPATASAGPRARSAINGATDALVTLNRQDFGQVPEQFDIALLSPQEALRRLSP